MQMKNTLNYQSLEPKILGSSQKGQNSLIKYTFDNIGLR